jgi:hypothetical protein
VLALALTGCAKVPPYATSAPSTSAPPASPTASTSSSSSASPSSTPSSQAVMLTGTGLAGFRFGSAESQVLATLNDRLGIPDEKIQAQLCDKKPDSPWSQTVTYGDVWVQFDAKDTKKSSPRTLAAWGYQLGEPLPKEFRIADNVPLDLTFTQLKAKYPAATYLNLGFTDTTKALQLPNKLMFMGAGQPEVVRAGEFVDCPD